MDINIAIRQFEQALIETINQNNLPIEIKRLAMLDVMRQVQSAADDFIQNAIVAENKEEESNDNTEH